MPREFRQGDRVTLDTGRHQFNGVIKHVSTINNNPVPYTVEFTDDLAHPNWQALPGAPHNSGSVTDSPASSHRFYRVRMGG